jgi:acylphosphatase
MAAMKGLPLRLRLAGWAVSLAGGTVMVLRGGMDPANPWPFATGALLMVAGMILTSVSGLVSHLRYRRSLLEQAEEKGRIARGEPPRPA